MAISVISQGAAASATLTLGTFAAGDLIVAFAFRDGSTTAPSLPAGFTQIDNLGANSCSSRAAYRIAVAGDTTFAFTNATETQWLVLRGQDAVAPIGTFARGGAADNQPLYGAISSFTNNNGSTWIIGFAGHRDATDMSTPTASGMTKRAPSVTTLACHTAENVSSFAGVNFGATVNASTGWRSIAVEVISDRTQMFPQSGLATMQGRDGADDPVIGITGSTPIWRSKALATSRGAGATSYTSDTVTGPTAGIVSQVTAGTFTGIEWLSPPIGAAVTIALPILSNWRMLRSSASANMGAMTAIKRIDSKGVVQSTILSTEFGTENASSETAETWTATPTSTALSKGDRIQVLAMYNDAGGTAAATFTETVVVAGAVGATGDSYVIFGESITFITATPAGTTLYLTTTASDANPGSANEYEAWTSRGGGVTQSATTTGAGRIQATETAGGTALEWYTKQLVAFTLADAITVNLRAKSSNATADTIVVEIAVTDSDGTNAVVWGIAAVDEKTLTTSEAVYSLLVSGPDTAVTYRQRLRIRVYTGQNSTGAHTITTYYAGTSGGASGDTFITLTQSVAAADPQTATPPVKALTLTTFAPTVTATAGNITATPDLATLTTATFAPTVTVSDNQLVTPDVRALTTTTYAPVIKLSVVPDTASLATATFAPTVSVSDNQSVTPDTASLSTSAFAPTVSVSDNQLVTPGVATLTTATFAPTVSVSDNQLVTPGATSLSLTAFAPSAVLSDNQRVTPDTATLAMTAFAPTAVISDHQLVTPDTASLTLTTFAPSVVVAPLGVYIPDTATLTLTTFAPAVSATGGRAYAQTIIIG